MKKRALILLLLFAGVRLQATHIVGGEMIYDYLGGDKYRVTLKVYRDCINGTSNFDGLVTTAPTGTFYVSAVLTIMETINSANVYTLNLGTPVVTRVPPSINNPCIQTPNNVCVEEGVYTLTVTLPATTGGYYLIYQRCCRNFSIVNLLNSGSQGSTYFARIPGPEEVSQNSSPRYARFPPIFLCRDVAFTFDHSAVDPDGDQLVYSLCPPFMGLEGCCGYMGSPPSAASSLCPNPPAQCPITAPPPPYLPVQYVFPYDGSYPISANPSVTIDPATGLLSGKPDLVGQFVVGVCVQEFRNGNLIDTHYRDFQFNIVPCVVYLTSAVADQEKKCMGNTITFTNQSTSTVGQLSYHWDFGVPGIASDTSNQINTSYTYQDTGMYVLTLISSSNQYCSDTLQKIVYVYPPLDIRFNRPQPQCLINNAFNFGVIGTYAAQTTFSWNFGGSASPASSTQQGPGPIVFSKSGYIPILLKAKQFSCRDSFIDSIRIVGRPKAGIGGIPNTFCDPVLIDFRNDSYSELPLSYNWQFSNGQSSGAFAPRITFSPPGNYYIRLVVTTTSLCVDTSIAEISFSVNPSPRAGFSCFPEVTSIFEPQIIFNDQASYDVMYWRYYFGDGDASSLGSPVHSYREFGNYQVVQVVTNRFGCRDTAFRTVVVEPEFRFWVPNTFTPDQNNINEIFRPSVYGVEEYTFQIYDEWGGRIFKTDDPSGGWDGTKDDLPCPQDVYIWRIVFTNQVTRKQEEHVGHVLLLRNQ